MSLCPHGVRIEHQRCDRCEEIAHAAMLGREREHCVETFQSRHRQANVLIVSRLTGKLVAAVYFEPETKDELDQLAIWKRIAQDIEDAMI